MSANERVDWIHPDGRTRHVVSRAEMRRRNLLHRVTATFVFHPDGRLFVHQRSAHKDVYAGLHDPCVGGTVISGEGYEENACREVAEELGIVSAPLHALFAHRFQDAFTHSQIQVYACVSPGPFRLQAEEVQGGDWHDVAALEARIAAGEVCPDSAQAWRLYTERFGRDRNFARDVAPGLTAIRCEVAAAQG